MLTLTLFGEEDWDEEAERFVYPEARKLEFEHSLVSLSKWESVYEKPFLAKKERTVEEQYGYIAAMLLTPDVDLKEIYTLTAAQLLEIDTYINRPMTGTTFGQMPTPGRRGETISSELVYYWMNMYGIKQECENWHLNRLFTLIRVHSVKEQKPKKGPRTVAEKQSMADLNRQRRAQLGTSG